jgi:hypothetical protein
VSKGPLMESFSAADAKAFAAKARGGEGAAGALVDRETDDHVFGWRLFENRSPFPLTPPAHAAGNAVTFEPGARTSVIAENSARRRRGSANFVPIRCALLMEWSTVHKTSFPALPVLDPSM